LTNLGLVKSVLTASMSHDSVTCRHHTRHAQYQTDTMQEGPREMIGLRIWTIPTLAPESFLLYNLGTVLCAWRRLKRFWFVHEYEWWRLKKGSFAGFSRFTSMA